MLLALADQARNTNIVVVRFKRIIFLKAPDKGAFFLFLFRRMKYSDAETIFPLLYFVVLKRKVS